MTPIVLVFEGKTPSKKNRYRIGKRGLFKDKKTVLWEKSFVAQLHDQDVTGGRMGIFFPYKTSRLALRFTYGDKRRRDTINGAESILDMLVKCRVIEDDNWKVIPSLELTGAYEKGVDRCVVEIWPA